jgi:hypothetical protein
MVSLSDFASTVRAKNRISFGDVQRLQRNVLPNGIGSREEAELLISLDGDIARADRSWQRWLVVTVVGFVVWTERPTGILNENTVSWLASLLTANADPRLTKTGRLIAREIAEEAQAFENDALATLAASLSDIKSTRTSLDLEPLCLAA